jgi:hypothetical protein
MVSIPATLRQQVIERARNHCESCQTPLYIVVTIEIDHIMPLSAGGPTEADNLCAACQGCNNHKLNFQEAKDPETDEMVPLFNPRTQQWNDHFEWIENGTFVKGSTPTGRATIIRLNMNDQRVVKARKLWVEAGWHPPKFD